MKCENCSGYGEVYDETPDDCYIAKCYVCNGVGEVKKCLECGGFGDWWEDDVGWVTCSVCAGRGVVPDNDV